jgi:hypothetical protein
MQDHFAAWTMAVLVVAVACVILRQAIRLGIHPPPPPPVRVRDTYRRLLSMTEPIRCYTETVGDGQHTRFRIRHNLGSRDAAVMIYNKDGQQVGANVLWNNGNTVEIETGVFVGLNVSYRFGPFRVPRLNPKLCLVPGSVPAIDSLKVTVVG